MRFVDCVIIRSLRENTLKRQTFHLEMVLNDNDHHRVELVLSVYRNTRSALVLAIMLMRRIVVGHGGQTTPRSRNPCLLKNPLFRLIDSTLSFKRITLCSKMHTPTILVYLRVDTGIQTAFLFTKNNERK